MKLGDKFSVSTTFDVEILGYFPAGEQIDRKAKYIATVNGYKMKVEADFLENLETISKQPKEEEIKVEETKKEVKKRGKRKSA